MRVEYRKDITEFDLPTITETLNLGFVINYIQADSTAIPINNNGILSREGRANLSVYDKEWEEIPGITLYDSIHLRFILQKNFGVPRSKDKYIISNGDINHILLNEEGKIYNLKTTRVEAGMYYFSTRYTFGSKINDEKLDNEDYVTILLDVSEMFSEYGSSSEPVVIPAFMDNTDTYLNVAHSIFPLGLYFAKASDIEKYEQEVIGEYVVGFPSGQNSGCGSNTIHRFFFFVDENNQLKKLSDTVNYFDYYKAGLIYVDESEMTFDEAKTMILEMLEEEFNQL